MGDKPLIVLITVPSLDVGKRIAYSLVGQKLAACVNILPKVTSIYTWEGKINEEEELLLLVKTRAELFDEKLIPAVKAEHPYDVPEIIAVPIEMGSKEYLGISVEELQAAIEEAKDAALAQAVEEGLITQAQADELAEGRKVFPFGGRWASWLSQEGIDYQAHLAEALGITTEELEAAYQQAAFARIDRTVENGLLSEEQADLMKGRYALFNNENFQSSMQSAFESAVNQAVAEGVITQAQADQILEQRENMWSGGRGGFFGGVFGGLKEIGGFGVFGPRGEGEWRFFEFKDRISPEPTETAPSDGA